MPLIKRDKAWLLAHSKREPIVECDFSDEDLFNLLIKDGNFVKSKLSCNFSAVIFKGTIFDECDFSGADLTEADLTEISGASFTAIGGVVLARSRLGQVAFNALYAAGLRNFHNVYLKGISLASVDISDVDFSASDLRDVDFTDAVGVDTVCLDGAVLAEQQIKQLLAMGLKDFSGVKLLHEMINFTGQSLAGVDFSGLDLTYVDFTGVTDTRGLNLTAATLGQAQVEALIAAGFKDFRGVHFTPGVNFSVCDLRGVNFAGAYFPEGVIFSGDLSTTNFTEVQLVDEFIFAAGTRLAREQVIQLYRAGLRRGFSLVDLTDVNLSGLSLDGISLAETYLDGATLTDISLNNVRLGNNQFRLLRELGRNNFSHMNLSLVDFIEVGLSLSRVNFSGSNLTGTTLPADLREVDFLGAQLMGVRVDSAANLAGARLGREQLEAFIAARITDFSNVDLNGADLSGLDLSGLNFTGANFAGANLYGCKIDRLTCFAETRFAGWQPNEIAAISYVGSDTKLFVQLLQELYMPKGIMHRRTYSVAVEEVLASVKSGEINLACTTVSQLIELIQVKNPGACFNPGGTLAQLAAHFDYALPSKLQAARLIERRLQGYVVSESSGEGLDAFSDDETDSDSDDVEAGVAAAASSFGKATLLASSRSSAAAVKAPSGSFFFRPDDPKAPRVGYDGAAQDETGDIGITNSML